MKQIYVESFAILDNLIFRHYIYQIIILQICRFFCAISDFASLVRIFLEEKKFLGYAIVTIKMGGEEMERVERSLDRLQENLQAPQFEIQNTGKDNFFFSFFFLFDLKEIISSKFICKMTYNSVWRKWIIEELQI